MLLETAEVRVRNAAYRYLRGLDDRATWDAKLWNILRGIWLDNGVEAVNNFVVHTGDMMTLMVGVSGTHQDIPPVRTNFTDADFAKTKRAVV